VTRITSPPKLIWKSTSLSHNYATIEQSPHYCFQWYTPHLPSKLPLPLRRSPPLSHIYTHPSTDPTHHPKRPPDPLSRFATVHFSDIETDRETDTQAHRQVSKISAYVRSTDRERRAIIIINCNSVQTYYFAPLGLRSIEMSTCLSVCLSVRLGGEPMAGSARSLTWEGGVIHAPSLEPPHVYTVCGPLKQERGSERAAAGR